jgi:hypothetical protein
MGGRKTKKAERTSGGEAREDLGTEAEEFTAAAASLPDAERAEFLRSRWEDVLTAAATAAAKEDDT